VPKTQAVKLIEAISDHIDGAVPFITIFCSFSLTYGLNGKQMPESDRYAFLKEFVEDTFLSSSGEIIAETSLVTLTAISYIIPKRPELVRIFEDALRSNLVALLGEGSPVLLRSRMALMLGYYADMLFKSDG